MWHPSSQVEGDIFACEEIRFCLCLRLLDFRTVQQCGMCFADVYDYWILELFNSNLIDRYGISVSQMITDMYHLLPGF